MNLMGQAAPSIGSNTKGQAMSRSIDDGGPAFPVETNAEGRGVQTSSRSGWETGMSLRDWFATYAPAPTKEAIQLQADLDRSRNPHNEVGYGKPPRRSASEIICDLAYEHADNMLKARKKPRRD